MTGSRLDKFSPLYTGIPKTMLPLGNLKHETTQEQEKIRAEIRDILTVQNSLMMEASLKFKDLSEKLAQKQAEYRKEVGIQSKNE